MPCFASLMTVAPIIYRYKMQKPNRGNVLKSPGTKPVLAALFLAVNNALGPPLEKKRLNAWFASLMTTTPIICRRDVNTGVERALATLFLALLAMK